MKVFEEILADIEVLRKRGYSAEIIIQKTGLSPKYIKDIVALLDQGVERQRKMVLKAEHAHQRLLLVVQGLKKLFADEHFVNLLRAEGLDTLPKYLAERINTLGSASTPVYPEPEGANL